MAKTQQLEQQIVMVSTNYLINKSTKPHLDLVLKGHYTPVLIYPFLSGFKSFVQPNILALPNHDVIGLT